MTSWSFTTFGQCDRTQDSLTLVKFYHDTDGPNWTFSEEFVYNFLGTPLKNIPNAGNIWDFDKPIDTWHGVELDSNNCLKYLALPNNGLKGILPEYLCDLTNVREIDLESNQLNGELPTSLAKLTNLKNLNLMRNNLEGCIPEELIICENYDLFNKAGFIFYRNHKMPFSGLMYELCNVASTSQIGAYCYDEDDKTFEDIIQEDCSCKGTYCQRTDSISLVNLYNATNGENWTYAAERYKNEKGTILIPNAKNEWSPDLPISEWHGVEVNTAGCVSSIYLNDNNLDSILPDLNFIALENFVVSENKLSGNFPSLWKSQYLKQFDCSNNQFSGAFPELTTSLFNYINCSNNQFSGGLSTLDSISVNHLDCSNNLFSGDLPVSKDYRTFLCGNNQFTGNISKEYELKKFDCSNNLLTGDIPSFSNAQILEYFDCSNNQLDGEIFLKTLSNLRTFFCQNNQLNGTIEDFKGGIRLHEFNCSNNNLKGGIRNFLFFSRMVEFDCSNNQFEDEFPQVFVTPLLKKFDCSNNKINGTFPEFRTPNPNVFEDFNCSGNQISGNLPDFARFKNLRIFDCSRNRLIGRIPDLTNLPDLEIFNCSSNLIGRSIPSLDSLPNLRIFDCSKNNISETLPDFNNNPNLEEFDCSNNLFMTGNIPDLSKLPNLIHFNCATNQLTGELPSLLKNKQLRSFIFSNNKITGKLHYSIERLDSLERFYGFNNQLEGCYPINFDKLCRLKNSTSTDSIGYNLSFNPMLPWFGDLQPYCDNEPQLDQPCDDGNPETHNDIIQTDCTCKGTIISGVKDIEKFDFQIYPNPTTGFVHLPTIDFKSIKLYNSSGQKIPIEIGRTLDISQVPMGVYYLKFQTADNIFSKKVVKK